MSFLQPKVPTPIPTVNPGQTANASNSVLAQQLNAGGRQATMMSTMAANTAAKPGPTLTGLNG